MSPEISVIILNFNTTEYLETLLDSSFSQLDFDKYEVILADNNSADKSFRQFQDKYPMLKIVYNISNNGFGEGNNEAVKTSVGKYLLFLNPDVRLLDNSVDYLKDFYENNDNVGIISGILVDDRNEPIYFYNNYWNIEWEFYQMTGIGYDRKIKKLLSNNEIKTGMPFEADWFHGAFLFISREIYDKLGGFNEKYFIYFEDVEICYRTRHELNLKNICLPYVKIEHATRATFQNPENDDIYNFHMYRSKLIFLNNYKFIYKNLIKLLSVTGIMLRLLALPYWKKFRKRRKEKFVQLINILRLHFDKGFLEGSKYKYITRQ